MRPITLYSFNFKIKRIRSKLVDFAIGSRIDLHISINMTNIEDLATHFSTDKHSKVIYLIIFTLCILNATL